MGDEEVVEEKSGSRRTYARRYGRYVRRENVMPVPMDVMEKTAQGDKQAMRLVEKRIRCR